MPDPVSLWGLLIPIRRGFRDYVNLRPARLLEGISSPLAGRKAGEIDFVIVRENSEGEYSEVGGRMNRNTEFDMAVQESIFTRRACDRIITYAFDLARTRKKHVTSATKSNGIVYAMPFWDERFAAISKKYPDVKADQFHIDILTAHFVVHPDWFDVVVGSNLFGDILSDLGAAVVGSIGLAPSANLNPEREYPSLFEPVHGSAPDISGKGIANPVAQIWSGAMMLEHLGEKQAAHAVEQSIFKVIAASSVRTRDIGGNASNKGHGRGDRRGIVRSNGANALGRIAAHANRGGNIDSCVDVIIIWIDGTQASHPGSGTAPPAPLRYERDPVRLSGRAHHPPFEPISQPDFKGGLRFTFLHSS